MLNVLKNNILILVFVLTGSTFTPVNGQTLLKQEVCAERNTCMKVIHETSPFSLILLLNESCEIFMGFTHLNTDFKSYLILHATSRNNKTKLNTMDRSSRNLYFHPFSTLDKTKYYVFALREIIV